MESVVRNVVEPWFETILKRLNELEKRINTIDTKITKMENEFVVLGCKLDNKLSTVCLVSSSYKMEEVD